MADVDTHALAHVAKLHGLGNDYLVVDPTEFPVPITTRVIVRLCDRHTGIGSDGVLLYDGTDGDNTFRLRIFNPDGSEAEKSGNGIRIFARWLHDTRRVAGNELAIQTLGGRVPVSLDPVSGEVTADMGVPVFREDLTTLRAGEEEVSVIALSMGNPHCVVLRETLDLADLHRLGPAIESHAAFPARTNVQLARVVSPERVEALIWERAAGETRASGSSACAVAAACRREDLVGPEIDVVMPGGSLHLRVDERGSIWMTGPVESIGEIILTAEFEARLRALA